VLVVFSRRLKLAAPARLLNWTNQAHAAYLALWMCVAIVMVPAWKLILAVRASACVFVRVCVCVVVLKLLVFGDNSMRGKDWRCRKRGTHAT
jgi:hypothetical protein